MTDLSSLERLYAAATKGRWVHDPDWRDDGASQILQAANTNLAVCFMATGMDKDEHEATAELIVALHNAFPALLAELRALRAVEKAASLVMQEVDRPVGLSEETATAMEAALTAARKP